MSSPRLPVFGNVARVALEGGSLFGVAGGDLHRFVLAEGCIAVNWCFLRSQNGFEMSCQAVGAGGANGCQG